jgi:hypothetical protein
MFLAWEYDMVWSISIYDRDGLQSLNYDFVWSPGL